MNVPRETIAAAFFGLMQQLSQTNGGPFVTVTRTYLLPTKVSYDADPGLYVVEWNESVDERQSKGEELYDFPIWVIILTQMPDPSSGIAPGAALNPLIDAVDNKIARTLISGGNYISVSPGESQTLGGIVNNCFPNGKIEKGDGSMFGLPHVFAKIPVSIVTGV